MRKPTLVIAPALVAGALLLSGYQLAAHTSPAPVAIARAASTITTASSTELSTDTPSPLPTATSVPATPTVAAPTPTDLPTNTPAPSETPAPTSTLPPTPTATRVPPTPTPQLLPPNRIVAPAIGLDAKVVTVGWHEVQDGNGQSHTEWDVASYAAGWHKNSARPGQVGNMVLSGHNNIEGEVFRNLEKFQVGDQITIYTPERSLNYVVAEKFVVEDKNVPFEQRLANAKWIGPFPDERLTLVSCWPPTNNTHRMFIVARPKR